jgi:multiple sugar transport system permease protein
VTTRGARRIALYVALAIVALIQVGPFLWAFQTSVTPLEAAFFVGSSGDAGVEGGFTWRYYADVFHTLPFARFLLNSVVISTAGAVGAVLSAAMAGYALARLPLCCKGALFAFLIASLLIPTQLLLLPHFILFDTLGWVGTYKPLIVPAWLGGGAFNVFLFRQTFRSIPRSVEEVALTDGASRWRIFTGVLLPMAKPTVAVAFLLSFVFHWHAFLYPLIYLSDFQTYPVSVGLRMFQTLAGTWVNQLMAAGVMATIPIVVLYAVTQRFIVGNR